jgi:hypothetical protein
MQRLQRWILPLLLIALGWNVALGIASYAQTQARSVDYLPIVTSQQPNAPATLVTLVNSDTTFVNAALVPNTCRVIVTYIDRANGNRLHVAEDRGTQLLELPLPPMATQLQSTQPDFEFTGQKHASGFPIVVCGRLRIYANSRIVDNGPFVLQRLDMPIP